MSVGKKITSTFRARDAQGNEYEVNVYVDTSSGNTTGGGSWTVDGFASAEAETLTGPLAGRRFQVTSAGGDDYTEAAGFGNLRISRVR